MATQTKHQTHPLRTLIVFLVTTAALYGIMALANVWTPRLGLDLRGGTTITLTARNASGAGGIDPASLELARTIIQQRVDSLGVGESEVTTSGEDQLVVAVPNVAPARLQEMVGQTAQLYFRPVVAVDAATGVPVQPTVEPSAEPTASATPNRAPLPGLPTPVPTPRPTTAAPVQPTADEVMAWTPSARDTSDFENYVCGDPFPDVPDQPLVTCDRAGTTKFLLAPVVLRGDQLVGATAGVPQQSVSWVVNLEFNSEGATIFEKATAALAKKPEPQNSFAVVLDSRVISYPSIDPLKTPNGIPGGRAEISGSFTQASASELANVLKYGALPLTFDLSEVSNVSPTLGGEQLRAGIIAGLIGLALVVVYSLFYYRALALVVVASLALAAAITYPLLVLLGESVGFALNLPGIAGAIVAIGVTADSFIIYFERIRDEVREGRSLRSAIETGWHGSKRTILVADAVSLLSAIVLFILAIGAVKGFAFTLGLTTVIDILIVFFFTKPLVTLLGRTKYFGEGRRFSGFEPEHMGIERRGWRRPAPRTPVKEA